MDRSDIIEQLYNVEDPELGMNIVDLGLVYGVEIEGNNVKVLMTLTYPGCPFAPVLIELVNKHVGSVEGIGEIKVEIVWDPAWNQNMIQDEILEEMRFAGSVR